MINVCKFSETTTKLEDLVCCKAYIIRQKINNNEKLTREDKNYITKKVNDNSFFDYAIPVLGWKFDFSDVLDTFIVNYDDHFAKVHATDKTALRAILPKNFKIYKLK